MNLFSFISTVVLKVEPCIRIQYTVRVWSVCFEGETARRGKRKQYTVDILALRGIVVNRYGYKQRKKKGKKTGCKIPHGPSTIKGSLALNIWMPGSSCGNRSSSERLSKKRRLGSSMA